VLDATLKEITAALLESDVNVKLVATLRQKVKAKVKAAIDGSEKSKDPTRKNVMQKVTSQLNDNISTLTLILPGRLRRARSSSRPRSRTI
jgi:signal recognition particle GTPase